MVTLDDLLIVIHCTNLSSETFFPTTIKLELTGALAVLRVLAFP